MYHYNWWLGVQIPWHTKLFCLTLIIFIGQIDITHAVVWHTPQLWGENCINCVKKLLFWAIACIWWEWQSSRSRTKIICYVSGYLHHGLESIHGAIMDIQALFIQYMHHEAFYEAQYNDDGRVGRQNLCKKNISTSLEFGILSSQNLLAGIRTSDTFLRICLVRKNARGLLGGSNLIQY